MSTSWITCATPSSWSCTGTCPRMCWTRAGRRLPLLWPRWGWLTDTHMHMTHTHTHRASFWRLVWVLRHRNTCVSCACRTWCGATARRSVPSGNSRWASSHHSVCDGSPLLLIKFKSDSTDGAENDGQRYLQGQEGQLPAECPQAVRQHQTQ